MNYSTALAPAPPAQLTQRPADLVAAWHDQLAVDVAAGQMAADTTATYRRGLGKFRAWGAARDQTTDTATRNVVKAWLADLRTEGKSPASLALWLSGVRAFFQWAISEGYVLVDPTQGVKAGKRKGANRAHKRATLTDTEMLRLLALPDLSKRDRAIMHLFAFTAARGVELHRAQLGDLHTRGEFLALSVQGKGRDDADEVLLIADKEAEAALRDWLAERGTAGGALFTTRYGGKTQAISRRQLRGIVKAAFKRAGVVSQPAQPKTTHSLRHTAITAARRNGASLEEAQMMARHASIVTTQIYDKSIDRLEKAAERHIRYGG